jgi:hypothetical protein
MTAAAWHIGQWLNAIQTTFVGLLRVWSVPIVLLLSLASGYTTYYGLSFFITDWIALIITIAVQSIVVICTLELAAMHWRANLTRFVSTAVSLLVAVFVSVSFSYFKFYEFSQRDTILIDRLGTFQSDINRYLESVVGVKSGLMSAQQKRVEQASLEASQAYVGSHPAMQGEFRNQIGKGPFWTHFNDILEAERTKLKALESRFTDLDRYLAEVRSGLKEFSLRMDDAAAYERMLRSLQDLQGSAENLAAVYGLKPVEAPRFGSYAEFARGITPSFAMWENISLFALACAAMVDFFTLVLSYRLEFTAPGPLTEGEKDLAYQGLRQFGEFTINKNDELEFVIEKTELERARRYSDWERMFAVAMLLNRGYLRKISERAVEFAPNLYPVIGERMQAARDADKPGEAANDNKLDEVLIRKGYGYGPRP